MKRSPPPPARLRWLIGAYLFVVAAYFSPGATWNPVSRFCLTRAIVETGSFEITPLAASTGDRSRVGERYYSDKAPIPSLLAVPAYSAYYAIARARGRLPGFEAEGTEERPAQRVRVSPAFRAGLWVSSVATSATAFALLGIAIFEVLRRRVGVAAAVIGALATLLGTPLLPYATSFFGHTIAAALLFGGFALTDSARALAPSAAGRRRVLAGLLLGLACGTEYVASVPALIVAGHAVYVASRDARRRVLVELLAGAAGPLVVIGIYHGICFGRPWRTGYQFIPRPTFARGHAQGLLGVTYPRLDALLGILVGRARGLFYVTPLALVLVVALIAGHRRTRDPALVLALLVLSSLVVINASYYMWDGGWATGPRHVVPALGFLALGAGLSFAWGGGWRIVMVVSASLSALVMLLTTAVSLESPPSSDAIFSYLLPALKEGKIARVSGASNFGIELGLSRRASVLPILGFVAVGAWWLTELVRASDGPEDGKQGEAGEHPA
jgi:hypothetical protein